MKKILALVAIAGVSIGVVGCGPKAEEPKKKVEAPKPDLGAPSSSIDMHDESKGKGPEAKPFPKDEVKPAPKEEPAKVDPKAVLEEAPPPEGKADVKDEKKDGPVNDTKDDKDEEDQK